MPWLIMYAINISALFIFSIMLFIYPMPIIPAGRPEFPVNRCLGLAPLTAAWILATYLALGGPAWLLLAAGAGR